MEAISRERFLREVGRLASDDAAGQWSVWADELVEMDDPDHLGTGRPADYFLSWIWTELRRADEEYGSPAAKSVAELSLHKHCLFPWEIHRAGEAFSQGKTVEEVVRMSLEGTLDEFQRFPEQESSSPSMT